MLFMFELLLHEVDVKKSVCVWKINMLAHLESEWHSPKVTQLLLFQRNVPKVSRQWKLDIKGNRFYLISYKRVNPVLRRNMVICGEGKSS